MRTLNDPIDYVRDDSAWSPRIGLQRGLLRGGIFAAILSALLMPVAAWLPYMVLPAALRAPLAFGIAWLLFAVVHRAAGMVGSACTLLVVLLTFVVLASQHLVFVFVGTPDLGMLDRWWLFPIGLVETIIVPQDGRMTGWKWLHPYVLFVVNVLPVSVGVGFCVRLHGRA